MPGEACPGPRLSQFGEPGAATSPNPARRAPFPPVASLPQVLGPGLGARRPELRSCWRWRWRWRWRRPVRPTTRSGVPRFLPPRGCFTANHRPFSPEGEGPLWCGSRSAQGPDKEAFPYEMKCGCGCPRAGIPDGPQLHRQTGRCLWAGGLRGCEAQRGRQEGTSRAQPLAASEKDKWSHR